MEDALILWTIAAAILGFFVSLIRRSIIHTSPGLFSQYFSKYGDDFDETEKLHRIDVLLTSSSLVLRAGFAGFLLVWREKSGAWYLPEQGTGTALEAWLLLVLAEVLFFGRERKVHESSLSGASLRAFGSGFQFGLRFSAKARGPSAKSGWPQC